MLRGFLVCAFEILVLCFVAVVAFYVLSGSVSDGSGGGDVAPGGLLVDRDFMLNLYLDSVD